LLFLECIQTLHNSYFDAIALDPTPSSLRESLLYKTIEVLDVSQRFSLSDIVNVNIENLPIEAISK
jgi:hypothetical protein